MKIWACYLFPMIMFFSGNLIAAESTATILASVTSTTTTIATDFNLRVEVTAPAGSQVTFDPQGKSLGAFDVINVQDLVDVPNGSEPTRLWTRIVTLQTLSLGEQTIPPVSVSVKTSDDITKLNTEPITITVQSTLEPEERSNLAEFRDIQGEIVIAETPTSINYLRIVFAALAVIVFFAILAFVFRKLRSRDRPLRWCQTRLQQLHDQSITRPHEFIRTADAVKEVLLIATTADTATAETRNVPMQSTPHCLNLLANQGFGEQQTQNLQAVLNSADRMKFSAPPSSTNNSSGISEQEATSLQRAITDLRSWIAFRQRSTRLGGDR
jgi:flagellar biogenesis protein FliO